MRIAAKLTCVAVLAALTGCETMSSLNPFSRKSTRAPVAELVDFKPTMAVRTAWSTSVGAADTFMFSPTAVSDSVYAAAANGALMRIDATSGAQLWRINAGMRLTAGVGSDGITVAVAGEKGMLMAFDVDGKLRWKAQASTEILSAPAVGQGLVIVRSADNRIAAYDADSGARRWVAQRNVPSLTLRNAPGITIVNPLAFVALPAGRLLALALSNGAPIWEASVGDPRGATELERIADISGAPIVAGREVCAVAYQGRVACFDAVNGAPRWAKDLSSDVGVAVDERFVFATDEHGVMSAFARDGGANAWRNKQLANRRLSTPASFGRAVAVGDGKGYLHFLSREDGAFLARTVVDGSAIVAAPVVVGDKLIVQTQAGTVAALTAQ